MRNADQLARFGHADVALMRIQKAHRDHRASIIDSERMGEEYTAKRTLLRGKSRSQPSLDNFVLWQICITLLAYSWGADRILALRQSSTLLKSFLLAGGVCIY